MAYDKPKVTIDLEEYNHLYSKLKELEERDLNSEIALHKKAIVALIILAGGVSNPGIDKELVKQGVGLQIIDQGPPYKRGEEYKALNVFEYKALAQDAR